MSLVVSLCKIVKDVDFTKGWVVFIRGLYDPGKTVLDSWIKDCSNRNVFARTQAEKFSNILIFIIKLYIYTVDP